MRFFVKTLLLCISVYIFSCSGGGGGSGNQDVVGEDIYEEPIYVTSDGKKFKLQSKKFVYEDIEYNKLIAEFEEKKSGSYDIYNFGELPERVFLKNIQTSIKNQAGRGTCVSFAVAAGVEAMYKSQFGLDLNLSEQYINHIQKMFHFRRNTNLPVTETMLGSWGGAGVVYVANLLSYYVAVPSYGFTDDYIPDGCFERTAESPTEDSSENDNPKYTWDGYRNKNPSYTQKAFNDFNLYQSGVFSNNFDLFNVKELSDYKNRFKFPQKYGFLCIEKDISDQFVFLNSAKAFYGISEKRTARGSELSDLNWYKRNLANGKVIVFGTTLSPAEFKNGVWVPKSPYDTSDRNGGHAMLIVGYDDSKNAFIVKNSWGLQKVLDEEGNPVHDAEGNEIFKGRPVEADEDSDGFILMDYKWATEGVIHSAVVINSVLNLTTFNQRYIPTVTILGRWEIHFGSGSETGEPTKKPAGILDIYHIPGAMSFRFRDYRVGTFFDNNNNGFRVNGSYAGNIYLDKNGGFTFYFNRDNPNMKPDENQQGKIFNSFFSDNKKWMAGYYTDDIDGNKYGFLAFKDFLKCQYNSDYCFKYDFREHPTVITDETYKGRWKIIDGFDEIRDVYFDSFTTDGDLKTYTGKDEYYDLEPNGTIRYHNIHNYQLKVNSSNPSEVEIIYTNRKLNPGSGYEETVEIYKGYLFKNNPYRMAGYYIKDGIKYPFYAERIKPPPLKVIINKPVLTNRFYGELYSGNIRFEAQVLNAEYYGLSSDYRILWSVRRGYDVIGEGYVIDVSLPYTDGYIEVIACLTKKNRCDVFDDIYSNIYLNIVNFPPSINITSPSDGSTFCAGQDITFRSDVTDSNGEDIIDSRIQWIFGNIGEKYGRSVTGKFLNPGSYIVTVRYADQGGEIGEDQITVNIENCTDYPPTIVINHPDNGSYLPDSSTEYPDGTEDITISVDFTASDPEDGNINSSDITWEFYIPDLDVTISGSYFEDTFCITPLPFGGCSQERTIKNVILKRVPSCYDGELRASVTDSAGNTSTDAILLKKRVGCNLK
ncbi:hypothetical protein [Persephonella sp.]